MQRHHYLTNGVMQRQPNAMHNGVALPIADSAAGCKPVACGWRHANGIVMFWRKRLSGWQINGFYQCYNGVKHVSASNRGGSLAGVKYRGVCGGWRSQSSWRTNKSNLQCILYQLNKAYDNISTITVCSVCCGIGVEAFKRRRKWRLASANSRLLQYSQRNSKLIGSPAPMHFSRIPQKHKTAAKTNNAARGVTLFGVRLILWLEGVLFSAWYYSAAFPSLLLPVYRAFLLVVTMSISDVW